MTAWPIPRVEDGPRDDAERLFGAIRGMAAAASFELAAREADGLGEALARLPRGSAVSVTWLPGDSDADRIAAARAIRAAGHDPVPHIAARGIADRAAFDRLAGALAEAAEVRRLFVIAGDTRRIAGEFGSALELIARCDPARHGIRAIGVGGYPEGHPAIAPEVLEAAVDTKLAVIADKGLAPFVVTQFAFHAAPILAWLEAFRARGNDAPVRIGLAGPANLRTLRRYARICGIGASIQALSSRGASIARLLAEAGPDPVIRDLAGSIACEEHGDTALHFFSFGGLDRTARWVTAAAEGRIRLRPCEAGFETLD
ncbi:methylenetetrahydrofolate reductase [Sphingomonas canadensis]|uniref:Methylenetetrahydrofolate reductase n=1 Tax=Sphingomonas canadensis TaxID=1219257 RepID=A0ABW3HDS6_9SPHN|nr:methylenetetrahydrofolate reductase [Sphingomonas canadensis]MCW3838285.1 methylenetetrahydrofolate reductase [Sphingomonas canadensis]